MATTIARGWQIAALAGAALIAAGAGRGVEAQERALDGWTFSITTSLEQTGYGGSDTLFFAGGSFESAASRRWGFARAAYLIEREREGTGWSAVARSPRGGEIRWRGIVFRDETISGSVVWTRPGRRPINYTFLGRRR